jgi:hypothetical protein
MGAIKNDFFNISVVPKHLRTYELCLEVVNQNRFGLSHVLEPEIRPTFTSEQLESICMAAINKHGLVNVFRYLPPEMRTYKHCLDVVSEDATQLVWMVKNQKDTALTKDQYDAVISVAMKKKRKKRISTSRA